MFKFKITDWEEVLDDVEGGDITYYERQVGVAGQPPLLLIRAIREKQNGLRVWTGIVRYAPGRGVMVASSFPTPDLYIAKKEAIHKARVWLTNFTEEFMKVDL